tara:strand:- start:6 stop:650 length:645 start_codon:yes stop_codon:yes gene_type:complete
MYELVEEAHKVLRVPPPLFDFESPPEDPKEIEKNMIEAIERYGGLGLSANQCGLPYKMFVMRTADKGVVSFWNPKLLKVSQDTDNLKEGCLSFPDIYLMIQRSKVIELEYYTTEGEKIVQTLEGMAARCVQHELDHLNGIIFLQRASRLKIERALKARPKERKKRLEYERRRAIAEYFAEQSKSREDGDDDAVSTSDGAQPSDPGRGEESDTVS